MPSKKAGRRDPHSLASPRSPPTWAMHQLSKEKAGDQKSLGSLRNLGRTGGRLKTACDDRKSPDKVFLPPGDLLCSYFVEKDGRQQNGLLISFSFESRSYISRKRICSGLRNDSRSAVDGASHLAFQREALFCCAPAPDWGSGWQKEETFVLKDAPDLRKARHWNSSSTIWPIYITPTRSEICFTMERSWAMKR